MSLSADKALLKAESHLDAGELAEAEELYKQVLLKFPENTKAIQKVIQGLQKLKARIASKGPPSSEPSQEQYTELFNLYNQGQFEEAAAKVKPLVSLFPKAATLYNLLGVSCAALNQYEAAIDSFKQAIKAKSDYAEAYDNMGNALQDKGDLDAAIESYKQAIKVGPDYAEAYNNMGTALNEKGDLDAAIESYKHAIKIKPDYAEAYNNMGISLSQKGEPQAAIKSYRQAIKIKPDLSKAVYNVAMLYYETGQYREAEGFFKRIESNVSQTNRLKCLYEQDEQSVFYDQLDYLMDRGENNAVIGSLVSRSEFRYGIKKLNPFCSDPLEYVLETNLTEICDFKNIFIEGAAEILSDNSVQHKKQSHLTNGIQTAGNVFVQGSSVANKIQNIIHSELWKYKSHFKNSEEGLIKSWPTEYSINGWLVSMQSGGELKSHMHDTGWITGSIYINVPPKSKSDSGNLVVCLDDEYSQGRDKRKKSIDVVTGTLCLFPASLLHYTIPFEAEEDRVVLAFDVIPK